MVSVSLVSLGLVNLDDNPLVDGELFMVGERICNHKDCVEIDHVR